MSVTNNGDGSLTVNGSLPEIEGTTVENTSFTINDADPEKKARITKLQGNTIQNGTPTPSSPIEVKTVSGDNEVVVCGKNKCITDYTKWEVGQYDTTGNKATFPQRARINDLIPVTPNTTLYFNTNNSNYSFVIRGYGQNKNYVTNYGQIINGNTITTTNVYYLGVIIMHNTDTSSTAGQTIIDKIQSGDIKPFICLNSLTDKTYQAYTGNSYRVDLGGKNKLINNSLTQTYGGITYTVNEDKSITLNGTSTISFVVELNNNMVLEQGQYTLSLKGKIQGCGVYAYVGSGTLKAYVSSYNTAENWQSTFALNEKTTFTQVRIDIQNGKTFNNITIYPQLEKRKCSNTIQSLCKQPSRTM